MSLVDRHEIGMLSSVMRALKHMEVHALRRQRPRWRSSAAAVGPAVRSVATQQASPTASPRTRRTVSPAGSLRGISGFGPLF
jgi:hypothetical protein